MNRTSHPDWVKMFGDSNGQIKLRAKKIFKFLSATVMRSSLYLSDRRNRQDILFQNPFTLYFGYLNFVFCFVFFVFF